MSISRISWSPSETSSRTRYARSDWSLDYLTISYSVSHSQAQALESVSSAKSQPKRYALSRMQTGFTEAKWKGSKEYKEAHGEEPSWMPNQYFAALTNMRSVGVMGDERTYDYAVAVRAVRTVDFMTAEAAEIPFEVLQTVMSRIINEVKGVNRVFYDLTSKPPGTIEFE